MSKQKQLGFDILENKIGKVFGGALLKRSNPKTARPISLKRPMHLVIKSSQAVGALSLNSKARAIADIVIDQGRTHGVKIYRYANAGNHLHLIVLPSSKKAMHNFSRSICGLIARLILGRQRRAAYSPTLNRVEKFWDARPFTRIVEWGRDFQSTCKYVLQNTLEAIGFMPYKPRRQRKSRTFYFGSSGWIRSGDPASRLCSTKINLTNSFWKAPRPLLSMHLLKFCRRRRRRGDRNRTCLSDL